MRGRKLKKAINKKEELPSFLLNLKDIPEDVDISPRTNKSVSYLGPLFFGECYEYNPPHHMVPLSSFHHVQFTSPSKENVLRDLFLPKPVAVRKHFESKIFRPLIQTRKKFIDPYFHKCPGFRRINAPDVFSPEGLGETKSIIEGETSREIPFCRMKKVSSRDGFITSKPQFEIVTLSDISEEKRSCKSYEEKIAHAHFPKEFVSVRVIGPTIPAPITITKLPSKRQTPFEIDLHLKPKSKKILKVEEEKDIKKPLEEIRDSSEERKQPKESWVSPIITRGESVTEGPGTDNEKINIVQIEEEADIQQNQIFENEEEKVETMEEIYGEMENIKENALEITEEENEGSLKAVLEENLSEEKMED